MIGKYLLCLFDTSNKKKKGAVKIVDLLSSMIYYTKWDRREPVAPVMQIDEFEIFQAFSLTPIDPRSIFLLSAFTKLAHFLVVHIALERKEVFSTGNLNIVHRPFDCVDRITIMRHERDGS